MNDKIEDLISTLELVKKNLLDPAHSIYLKDTDILMIEILSKYTEFTSEKDFDDRIMAEGKHNRHILLKMREELVQKSYEEELETTERSHKQRIIDINYELFQNITEKIIEVETIKKILNDESIETFHSPGYTSPLIDKTPLIGVAAPLPECGIYAPISLGPHVVYRLPEYSLFDHLFKIKTVFKKL
ncbi:hypothetical protein MXB_4246 [Myxobolus squamalis]|nr:hypothetical protein MXB_4246 [Myxobolus squamalis]